MHSNESIPIQIKANRDGFILVPEAKASFDSIMTYMQQRLEESHDFFHNAEMVLDLREKPLRTDEILALNHLLEEKSQVKLSQVKLADSLDFLLDRPQPRPAPTVRQDAPGNKEPSPLVIRTTCRSGARVVSPSDCVVLGDVNPGAEIIAVGDIVVFGSLRGLAHAGATGNRSARIWAISIAPHQIRIADLVAVPPQGNQPIPKRYEIAEIQGDSIEVITV
ncbi:septum site-determining protein MinC [Desulforhabdus sp. TSK]|uniref:septum site-determining protein MinC n=1 Tax=Desulforhabdus sp. TSK TaxID=2925014 RepID=UPI001FC89EDC|nr:septum site-determining protein MinC [Desulforhabdus sp. TSK]GKT08146.1 septum site-determining protein MinC [Desulforhabdus sp. TSK]